MSQIGTVVTNSLAPTVSPNVYDTGTSFKVGLADWGPVNSAVTLNSVRGAAQAVGPRSGTNTTVSDSLEVFFKEGGKTAIFSRVAGPSASAASLTLSDANPSAALIVAAQYVGAYGNQIQVQVQNSGASFTVILTDTYGTSLASSPALTSRQAAVSWAATTGYVTIAALSGTSLPATSGPTLLTGGTDDRAHVTITHWQNALNAFPATLGPGQVSAPGQTNAVLPGIWAALGAHAQANNRVALWDLDDNVSASYAISQVGTTFQSSGSAPGGYWVGNLACPGVVPGTLRSIPPSAVIAALCARADGAGNPNLAAAGRGFPLRYCLGSYSTVSGLTETYNVADVNSLNSAGINTFALRFGLFQNFGFVSSILPANDIVFWQLNHARLRMAITASAQVIAEPYLFSQLDGSGGTTAAFASDLSAMLLRFYKTGALYGNSPSAAFSVDVGPTVNTPATLQSGQLNAAINVRMSPFAELITININTYPITSQVPVGSATTATASS